MHPHLYELDHVQLTIQQNHRDALHQAQLDVGWGTPRPRIVTFAVRLRAGIAAILMAVGAHLHRAPAASRESGVEPQSMTEPVDSTSIA